MVSQELAQKLGHVVQQFAKIMPKTEFPAFQQAINSYIKTGSFRTTGHQNVNNLAQAVIQSMTKEMTSNVGGRGGRGGWGRGYGGYGGYGGYRNYWYQPWWWNYWSYQWYPYYWWPYNTYGYVGGSKVGHSAHSGMDGPLSVLDQAVDINSINMSCDDTTRVCNLSMQFTKAPVSWEEPSTMDLGMNVFKQQQ